MEMKGTFFRKGSQGNGIILEEMAFYQDSQVKPSITE